ncbi:CcmD family protein [Fuchsiella alkaliacetigena]|nr:CcmD family protein [Fuchsiella alkaliacetigena]MCK8825185.1 CcmD family protein [Fuchsiella alkaliacetigena]
MDNLNYLFIGYLVIWIIIFVYTLNIGKKQKKLEKDIDFIKRSLEQDLD